MKAFFFRGDCWLCLAPFQRSAAIALLLGSVIGSTRAASLLDGSFAPGSGPDNVINAIGLQADGRLVIVGAFSQFDSVPRHGIARLNADGGLDTSFDPGAGADDVVTAVAVQADGHIIIGGFFTAINGTSRNGIARLNGDGSLDASFDPGAGVEPLTGHPQVHAVSLQSDGKIVVGGYFRTVNGASRDGIAQLNNNGSVDSGFDPGTGLEGYVALAVAAQTNGQVLVAGIFPSINGISRKSIARLNATGSVDGTFVVPGGGVGGSNALERVYALAAQPDGKVILGGDFTQISGERRQHLARLNPDGSLDETFDPGILYLDQVSATVLQSDGRIVIGGAFRSMDGVNRNGIARVMNDGSLDLGFDPGAGIEVPPFYPSQASIESVALQPDGRIIVAGLFETFDTVARKNIARLRPGVDTNLAIVNFAPPPVNGPVRENAGTLIVTINRIGSHDGVTAVDYSTEDGTAKAGMDYVAQSSKIIFAAGERTKTISIPILNDSQPENDELFQLRLTNVSADAVLGSLSNLNVTILDDDPGVEFSVPTYSVGEIDKNVAVTVRRVGPITAPLTVDFTTMDGTATAGQDYVAQSGTLKFGYFLNRWERVKTFSVPILDDTLLEGSETILLSLSNPVGGVLGSQSTASVFIQDNDSAGGPGRGANGAVQVILALRDGKSIIGGEFTFLDGVPRNRVARINENTTLDMGFEPGAGADGTVYALALQADGKVLMGGSFTNLNGIRRNGIARLNADGSLDPQFDPRGGVQGSAHGVWASVRSIAVQTNGQIVIGGFFSGYGGLPRDGIARLNADGSVDPLFNPSYGQDAVFPIVLESDGRILAGGYFRVSGLIVEFARLNNDGSVDEAFTLGADELLMAHVSGIAVGDDGKILMNGHFVFRETNRGFVGVLRFNNVGSIDTTYVSTNVIAGYVNSFVFQEDHKLLVGGRAAAIPGINAGGVTRLNLQGTVDRTFNPVVGPEGDVFALALQPGGTILLGGSFRTVNGVARNRIAQLNPDGSSAGSIQLNVPTTMPDGRIRLTTRSAATTELIIQVSSDLANWLPVYTNTTLAPLDWIDTAATQGQRFYRAVTTP
ncbi:MAG TPA: Calx-beta domain-containing protein [Candidatus Limnocylindrales bacterium]|jgi:uncharacterized delta-60 repeat protein|nr:Calx-beta domain-containing protein [Candidatus Limnocylindrales bacterium]